MANNIQLLNGELERKKREDAELNAENFDTNVELTPEEQERLKAMAEKPMVIVEEQGESGVTQTSLKEYASGVDDRIKNIKTATDNMIKGINTGDIKKTTAELKEDAKKKAIATFKAMANTKSQSLSEDEVLSINDKALYTLQAHFEVDRLDSNDLIRRLKKLTLRQICNILPDEFVEVYLDEKEIAANNYKAKDRLLATISYLTVTGPEMDYLNEYIDHEDKLMMVMNRLAKCQIDISEALQSEEKLTEIATKARELSGDSDEVWKRYIGRKTEDGKYIRVDPKFVHTTFAQKAIIAQMSKEAYEKIMDEYPDDPDAQAQVQEQIDECENKHCVYTSVLNLDTMRNLWYILTERLAKDSRGGYKNLKREAVAAIDRIRRAKQNVNFPVYSKIVVKKPEELYKLYMEQFPMIVKNSADTIDKVYNRAEEEATQTTISRIEIEGVDIDTIAEYFSILILILYGRLMKALGDTDSKFEAIELDAYFTMYCQLGKDYYLMSEIWNMMKDFVKYSIENWPKSGGKH